MNFEISCYDLNPLAAFPLLRSPKLSPGSTANVTCLVTAMPKSGGTAEYISLSRGLNIITVCLVVAASVVGTSLLSGPLWLEGSQFSPGLQTLSGPIDLRSMKRTPYPGGLQPPFLPASLPGYSKCRPSRPIPPVPNECAGIWASQSDDVIACNDPNRTVFITNVLIRSNKGSAYLPFNVSLGTIRPTYNAIYQDAVCDTAKQLSENWHACVTLMDFIHL